MSQPAPLVIQSSSGEGDKKRRFSVLQSVQTEEKEDEPLLKLVLSDEQTKDYVRKISEVSQGQAFEDVLTEIKSESEFDKEKHNKHRSSFMQALRGSRSSLSHQDKEESTKLIQLETISNLPGVVEETEAPKQTSPAENTTHYTKRLVEKNGSSNVLPWSSKRSRFITDFYTTLADLKWRNCLLMFIMAYLSSWTIFSVIYYIIISIHQDITQSLDSEWDFCMTNVYDFVTCFLFSIETQHTIGYGSRAIKETCPPAVITFMIQSCASVLINSLFCGLIFAKLMSPQYRSRLIRFSKQAVISFNRGVPCFIFRVIDFKESNLVNCDVKAVLIRDRVTKEGEFIPFSNRSLSLHIEETVSNSLFLVWPVNVIHVIDSQSPLFGLEPRQLQEEYLEIIVILEGVVENSGKLMQVRTSYSSREILWGASFSPMLTFNSKTNKYEMDYAKFDEIQLTLPLPFVSPSKRRFHNGIPRSPSNSDSLVVSESDEMSSSVASSRKYSRSCRSSAKSKKIKKHAQKYDKELI